MISNKVVQYMTRIDRIKRLVAMIHNLTDDQISSVWDFVVAISKRGTIIQ